MRVKNKKRLQAQRGKQMIYHKGRLIWLSGLLNKERLNHINLYM